MSPNVKKLNFWLFLGGWVALEILDWAHLTSQLSSHLYQSTYKTYMEAIHAGFFKLSRSQINVYRCGDLTTTQPLILSYISLWFSSFVHSQHAVKSWNHDWWPNLLSLNLYFSYQLRQSHPFHYVLWHWMIGMNLFEHIHVSLPIATWLVVISSFVAIQIN